MFPALAEKINGEVSTKSVSRTCVLFSVQGYSKCGNINTRPFNTLLLLMTYISTDLVRNEGIILSDMFESVTD